MFNRKTHIKFQSEIKKETSVYFRLFSRYGQNEIQLKKLLFFKSLERKIFYRI